jgi:hypothetical protein
MTFPKARLAVSAALFVSWLGFLGYLVYTSSKVVLSRPQFMIAQLYVVADVRADAGNGALASEIAIEDVVWSARKSDALLVNTKIILPEISACGKKQGNRGPGKYLLPLQRTMGGDFELASVPQLAFLVTLEWTDADLKKEHHKRHLPVGEADDLRLTLEADGITVTSDEHLLSASHGTLESFGLFSHHTYRRLPIQAARAKRLELKAAGYVVHMNPEDIRIYGWDDGTRVQVEELIRRK